MALRPLVVHVIEDDVGIQDLYSRSIKRLVQPDNVLVYSSVADFQNRLTAKTLATNAHHLFLSDYDLKDHSNAPGVFKHLDSLIQSKVLDSNNFSFVGNSSEADYVTEFSLMKSQRVNGADELLKRVWGSIKFDAFRKPFSIKDILLPLLESWGLITNSAPPLSSSSPSAKEAH